MTNTNKNTNDFQSLFRAVGFRKMIERGMSLRFDLSDKIARNFRMAK